MSDYIHTIITSDTCPDLRCFVSNTFYIIYSTFKYLSWSQVFRVRLHSYYYNFRYLSWSQVFRVRLHSYCYNFRYLSWSQVFRVRLHSYCYNFRYLSWSQVFRVKYLLYYIQYLEIPLLISGVSCQIPFILYTVPSNTCPDLRCFVSDYIHTVITSDTCPDHRCFVSNTFYIIYSNFRYLSWSQVFRVKYILYYIQYYTPISL